MARQQKSKIVKAHVKQATLREIKERKRQEAEERQDLRNHRTDKEQLAFLDSRGYIATRERDRLNASIGRK